MDNEVFWEFMLLDIHSQRQLSLPPLPPPSLSLGFVSLAIFGFVSPPPPSLSPFLCAFTSCTIFVIPVHYYLLCRPHILLCGIHHPHILLCPHAPPHPYACWATLATPTHSTMSVQPRACIGFAFVLSGSTLIALCHPPSYYLFNTHRTSSVLKVHSPLTPDIILSLPIFFISVVTIVKITA